MAITSTYLGTFGGGSPQWTTMNRSGSGLGSNILSMPSGRMAVVEVRTTSTNRQIRISKPGSILTITLQTAGTYYQVLEPSNGLSMESTVTLVRYMEFDF